jgi:hypothetical protein
MISYRKVFVVENCFNPCEESLGKGFFSSLTIWVASSKAENLGFAPFRLITQMGKEKS